MRSICHINFNKIVLSILILLTIAHHNGFSQITNLITNGSFEDKDSDCPSNIPSSNTRNGEVYQLKKNGITWDETKFVNGWVSRNHFFTVPNPDGISLPTEVRLHSPDYYENNPWSNASDGSHYVGMAGYELIQQNLASGLRFAKDKQYLISFDWKYDTDYNNPNSTCNDFELRFFLSKKKLEYKSEVNLDKSEQCDADYTNYQDGLFQDWFVLNSFKLRKKDFTSNNWNKAEQIFYSDADYLNHDWLNIDLVRYPETNNVGCTNCYIYIDNIKIYEFCQDPCKPIFLSDINYYVPNAMHVNSNPFSPTFNNITRYKIEIFDRWGGSHLRKTLEEFNPNGLDNGKLAPSSDISWTPTWNGKDDNGNDLPQGVYDVQIELNNCNLGNGRKVTQTELTLLPDGGNATKDYEIIYPLKRQIETPFERASCCLTCRTFSESISSINGIYRASDYIMSGGNTTITANQNIVFEAGHYIELYDGFETNAGAIFTAQINSCAAVMRQDASNQNNNIPSSIDLDKIEPLFSTANKVPITTISIHPNPAKNTITLTIPSNESAHVTFTDMLGNLVLEAKYETSENNINISSLTNGVYFIKAKTANKLFVTKIIKE